MQYCSPGESYLSTREVQYIKAKTPGKQFRGDRSSSAQRHIRVSQYVYDIIIEWPGLTEY